MNFLKTTPYLQSLGLVLDNNDLRTMKGKDCITLTDVDFLTITYCHSEYTGNYNENESFMAKLKLPQLKRVVFNTNALSGLNTLFGSNTMLWTTKSLELNNLPVLGAKEGPKESMLLYSYDQMYRIFPGLERLDIRTQGYLFWYNPNVTSWKSLRTVSFRHGSDFWRKNIAGLIANKNFASRLEHLRIYGLPMEEMKNFRVDVTIRKILGSVFDEEVLEVQPWIMAAEKDSVDLFHMRSRVEAGDADRQ